MRWQYKRSEVAVEFEATEEDDEMSNAAEAPS